MRRDDKKNLIKILAIETSCDETAAAVTGTEKLKNERTEEHPVVLSNVVSSQVDLHAKTGGVVPEVASRAHMEAMIPVVEQALQQANLKFKIQNLKLRNGDLLEGITHVAVTNGPGLIGSLLVGFNAAKTIAYARNLPLIPINHIEGHIYSALAQSRVKSQKSKVESDGFEFPILALTVSGGHTSLTLMHDHGKYQTIGETIDDAAGEAFDKVAKLLGLGYPGGPVVSEFASKFRDKISKKQDTIAKQYPNSNIQIPNNKTIQQYSNSTISFPRPLINKPNFDFSFSGLKTAVLTQTIKHPVKTEKQKEEICWAFEEAVVDVLVTKTLRATKKYHPKTVILAGGVAANSRLRQELSLQLKTYDLALAMPLMELCGDNAAMIGLAAYYHIEKNNIPNLFDTTVDSNATLGEQALA